MFKARDLIKLLNFTYHLLAKLLTILFHLFQRHAHVCLTAFDSIHEVPPGSDLPTYRRHRVHLESQHIHPYFLLPVALWLYMAVDYARYYLQHPELSFDDNPHYLTHRMYAPKFWQQGDMLVGTVSSGVLCIGLTFLFQRWLDDRFCMYLVQRKGRWVLIVNGKVWNIKNGAKIARFGEKSRQFVRLLLVPSNVIALGFFLFNFLNSPFSGFEHYFKMVVFLPIFTWYAIFTVAMLFSHFFILTVYVSTKQSYLLSLQSHLLATLHSPSKRRTVHFPTLYQHFHAIQSHFAYQCAEIRALNRFWALPLTILFACEIVTFCYLLYSCLFYEQTPDQFVYFFFYLLELGAFIFLVIYRASVVDHHNDRAYERNVHLCVLMQHHFRGRITERQMINIEKLSTNRNFPRCCFRLANGYRVDSTAFQLASYIISTFFLMICRRHHRNIGLVL